MRKVVIVFSIFAVACLSACSLLPVGDADTVLNQAKQSFAGQDKTSYAASGANVLVDIGREEADSIAVDFFDGSGMVIFRSNGSATWSLEVKHNPMSLDEKELENSALRQVKWVTRKYGG